MSEPESTQEAQAMDPVVRELLASRERLGMSQREMADALEVHPSTLSRYESGKLKVPTEVVDKVRALVQDAEAARRIAPAPPPAVAPATPVPAAAASAPAPVASAAAPVARPAPAPAPAPPPVPAPAVALARAPDLRLLARRLTVWCGLLAAGQLVLAGLVLTRCTGAPLWSWGGSAFTRGGGARTEANPGLDLPPPCHRGETEIGGNCWALLEVHSPCPDYALEHDGKCYVPPPRNKRRAISGP